LHKAYFSNPQNYKIFTSKIAEYVITSFEGITEYEHYEPKYTAFSEEGMSIFSMILAFKLGSPDCYKKISEGSTPHKLTESCLGFPTFGSSVTFELSRDHNGANFVKTLFNGKSVKFCSGDMIGDYCPFDGFLESARADLIDLDLVERNCTNTEVLHEELAVLEEDTAFYRIGAIIGICLSSFFLVCIVIECMFRQRDQHMIKRTLDTYKEKSMNGSPGKPGSASSIELQGQ
jgi:hypothetical protein